MATVTFPDPLGEILIDPLEKGLVVRTSAVPETVTGPALLFPAAALKTTAFSKSDGSDTDDVDEEEDEEEDDSSFSLTTNRAAVGTWVLR